jgi:maltose O-acetyltransferase
MLDARHQPIVIGNNVDIGRETAIFTLEHDPNSDKHAVRSGSVSIEDYAWIAARVVILPGVRVGKGAVIGAGSIVTKDVEPMTIVAGNPAKFIGYRRSKLEYETQFFPFMR